MTLAQLWNAYKTRNRWEDEDQVVSVKVASLKALTRQAYEQGAREAKELPLRVPVDLTI